MMKLNVVQPVRHLSPLYDVDITAGTVERYVMAEFIPSQNNCLMNSVVTEVFWINKLLAVMLCYLTLMKHGCRII